MNEVISQWTLQVSSLTSGVLGLAAAVAVIVLIVTVIKGFLANDDRDMGETIVKCLIVIAFLILGALAPEIVAGVVPAASA